VWYDHFKATVYENVSKTQSLRADPRQFLDNDHGGRALAATVDVVAHLMPI
jgi:hypothetical protein